MSIIDPESRGVAYFAADGNYGDAAGLVTLDTSAWDADTWEYVAGTLTDDERYIVARNIADGRGSIDVQDCPGIYESGRHCRFTGPVMRMWHDPERGEDGGYVWECPKCGTVSEWEGEE